MAIAALEDGDQVGWVKTCDSTDSIIVATKKGYATHFPTDVTNLRPTGRTSRGVKVGHGCVVWELGLVRVGAPRAPPLSLARSLTHRPT